MRSEARFSPTGPITPTVAIALTSLLVCLFVLFLMWRQTTSLKSQLQETEERADALTGRLEESRRQAEALRREGEQAQSRAEEAAEQARALSAARRQAELERELAREDAELSREKTEQAKREAARLQAETERMRKQRIEELDRMREALSQIAETRRTPMGMVVNLGEDSFLFDFDKDTLRPENREMLSRIAGVLLASHGYRLQVYGHTDDLGPAVYNKDLSERRAKSVSSYLVSAGIPSEVIDVEGFGEASPRVGTATSQGRQKNRRVEIGVIDTIINYSDEIESP